jgi:phosphoribosylformimino-5-aminoimidazole carboxamide ribotide isomerase
MRPTFQGDCHSKKTYSDNPLDMAKQFEDFGVLARRRFRWVKAKQIINYKTLELWLPKPS